MKLGVNIDHFATVRQARYAGSPEAPNAEPDLVLAAALAEGAGASGITVHLRADRRHIQDRDVYRLRETINTKLNLEMGNTPQIVGIALQVLPEEVCLVPEHRQEITTEGGLDVVSHRDALRQTIDRLQAAGVRISLFIEPSANQIEMAARLGAEMVELHTGAFANAVGEAQSAELERLVRGAQLAASLGLQVNAGHGINYQNIGQIITVPHLAELNIGHSLVARALYFGLEAAVSDMLALMNPSSDSATSPHPPGALSSPGAPGSPQ